jgi:translation elongation factor P/translation initiation factor 5A
VEDYKEVIEEIGKYFQLMDEKYYSELEGSPDDMQDLAEFLNDQRLLAANAPSHST